MKTHRWFALLYGLLVVGMLAATAPPEATAAGASVLISLDNNTYNTVPTDSPTTVSTAACPFTSTYSACVRIHTGVYAGGKVTINDYSSGNPARLLIQNAKTATTTGDLFALSGVKFLTNPGAGVTMTVYVKYANTFSDPVKPANSFYKISMRSGGFYVATDGSSYNNSIKLTGTIDPGTGTAVDIQNAPINPRAKVYHQLLSPTSNGPSQFDKTFDQEYPGFACSGCAPIVTEIFEFTVKGPDQIWLSNSDDSAADICDPVPANINPPPGQTAWGSNPCPSVEAKLKKAQNNARKLDNAEGRTIGADEAFECGASDGCECNDPEGESPACEGGYGGG